MGFNFNGEVKMMIKTFLFIAIFSVVLFGQQNSRINVNNSYTSARLVVGVPAPLAKIRYFSPQNSISHAVVYNNEVDSLYFVVKSLAADSNSYFLVLTSNGVMRNYDSLNLEQVGKDTLHAMGTLKTAGEKPFNIALYYLPKYRVILYSIRRENNFFSSTSKFLSEYNVDFELAIRDEMYFIYGNPLNSGIMPLNFHLTIGLGFLKYFKVYLAFGLMRIYYRDAGGVDYGFFLEANFFKTNIYGIVGLDYSGIFGSQLPHDMSFGNEGALKSLCLGGGYRLSKNFSVDLLFYLLKSRVVINHDPYEGYGTEEAPDEKINRGFIGLGFQYSFIF
jgi:hypothetical protein